MFRKPNQRRVLPFEQIPNSIWDGDVLRLPKALSESYKKQLTARGLLCAASVHQKGNIIGGREDDDSTLHFAQRFVNSSARAIYVLLAPSASFQRESDILLSICSYGRVTVLDAPCGAGAFSVSLVSTLMELRSEGVLPTLPLSLTVVGADISPSALGIFGDLIGDLVDEAASTGILLKQRSAVWDATNDVSTQKLIDLLFEDSTAHDHLVVIPNVSGELSKAKKFGEFTTSFRMFVSRHYAKQGAMLWIEPATNSSKDVWTRLKNLISQLPYCGSWNADRADGQLLTTEVRVFDPILERIAKVQVSVYLCERFPPN